MGYSPGGRRESDTTDWLSTHTHARAPGMSELWGPQRQGMLRALKKL